MRIPPYQWLMPEQKSNCDFCDEVSISSEYEPKFQVLANEIETENLFPNGDYETNPFSPITSNDFVFNFNWDVDLIPYGSYFTLYIENNIYIFKFIENTNNSPFYTTLINGNVTIIDINIAFNMSGTKISASSIASRLQYVLDNIIDVAHTTTSTIDGIYPFQITIANIPNGSYLDDTAFSILTNISTIGTSISGIHLENGFYNSTTKQLNYLFLANFVSGSMIIKTNVVLEVGKLYRFQFGYYLYGLDTTVDEFIYRFSVLDNTNSAVFDIPSTTLLTSFTGNNIKGNFSVPADGTYTLEFTFNSTVHTSQLAFDNCSITQIGYETLNNVEVINCNNQTLEIDYATTIHNENILVEILEPLPNPFQLKFTDGNNNVFYSRWYSIKDEDDCDVQFKIDWTNNCKFSDLDYTNLPFTNQLLLTGVKIKNTLDIIDSVDNITPDGRKISIYKNTQQTYELRLHPYSEDTQGTLERIFEHSEVKINDELYNAVESYQTSEIDLGVYTGRVDLYKDGTQLITSSCCC